MEAPPEAVEAAERAAGPALARALAKYEPIRKVIADYCAAAGMPPADATAVAALRGVPCDTYAYYADAQDAFAHAKEIAKRIFESDPVVGRYAVAKGDPYRYSVFADTQEVCVIWPVEAHRGAPLYAVLADPARGALMSAALVLIDACRTLCNPAKVEAWPGALSLHYELLDLAAGGVSGGCAALDGGAAGPGEGTFAPGEANPCALVGGCEHGGEHGGEHICEHIYEGGREDPARALAEAVWDLLPGEDVVVLSRRGRLRLACAAGEALIARAAKKLKRQAAVGKTVDALKTPGESRLRVQTYYVDRKAAVSIYNTPEFELTPYVVEGGRRMGSPFAVLYHIYLDIWTTGVLGAIGKLADPGAAAAQLWREAREVAAAAAVGDPAAVWPERFSGSAVDRKYAMQQRLAGRRGATVAYYPLADG